MRWVNSTCSCCSTYVRQSSSMYHMLHWMQHLHQSIKLDAASAPINKLYGYTLWLTLKIAGTCLLCPQATPCFGHSCHTSALAPEQHSMARHSMIGDCPHQQIESEVATATVGHYVCVHTSSYSKNTHNCNSISAGKACGTFIQGSHRSMQVPQASSCTKPAPASNTNTNTNTLHPQLHKSPWHTAPVLPLDSKA
jgi:hypothetical protein